MVKCLPCRHEDPSSIPQNPHKNVKSAGGVCLQTQGWGEGNKKNPEKHSSPASKKKGGPTPKIMTSKVDHWLPHRYTCSPMNTHTQRIHTKPLWNERGGRVINT